MRRRFNRRERFALYQSARGRSAISGAPLGDDWQADHIVPFALGGPTDVVNGQALTARENRVKGVSKMYPVLRPWQQDFYDIYQKHEGPNFALGVLPAGGKTIAALHAGKRFLSTGPDRRLLVTVPTVPLCKQWTRAAHQHYGIELTTDFDGVWRSGFHGAVTTYSGMDSRREFFRIAGHNYELMAVCDEIHHAGERAVWGDALAYGLEFYKKRLLMTGTPFKTDSQRIAFMEVGEDNFYKLDYTYDYPRALRDGVVRAINFHTFDAKLRERSSYGEIVRDTRSDLSVADAQLMLSGLTRDPTFQETMVREGARHLDGLHRGGRPYAKALVICSDMFQAQRVAALLQRVTGEAAAVVVSDEDKSTSTIEQFKRGRAKWIVAVKMVSEGIDIPELAVLVWLTSTATLLFFRQAIGRIMRRFAADNPDDEEAVCLIPHVPHLVEYAKTIMEFQIEVQEELERERRERTADLSGDAVARELEAEDIDYRQRISQGEAFTPEEFKRGSRHRA